MLFAKMKKKMLKLVRSFNNFEPKCTSLNNTKTPFSAKLGVMRHWTSPVDVPWHRLYSHLDAVICLSY